jgi:hypothetical protein
MSVAVNESSSSCVMRLMNLDLCQNFVSIYRSQGELDHVGAGMEHGKRLLSVGNVADYNGD